MKKDTMVITITREFGSLGRPIARQVAEKLGFDYYDRDMIEAVAESMGEQVTDLLEYGENTISPYRKMMNPLGYGANIKQKKLFEIEKKIILNYAKDRNCVIVGRCADYILSESRHKNLFNVYVYAPFSAKYGFCVDSLGLDSEVVVDYITKVTKAREDFYKKQTGESVSSTKYRHLMIDSSSMPLSGVVETICGAATRKFNIDKKVDIIESEDKTKEV